VSFSKSTEPVDWAKAVAGINNAVEQSSANFFTEIYPPRSDSIY
jgi:hypothetical protein